MNNNISARRFLVTGASGFVGTRLVEYLVDHGAFVVGLSAGWDEAGHFVRSGLYQRVVNLKGSVEDEALLERTLSEHGIDTVLHLAAVALEGKAFASPLESFNVNIRGTYTILEACRKRKIGRVVVASSDKAYGDHPVLPYTEDMPLIGKHPYDVSKSCADLIAQTYSHSYGLPIVIARFGNVFGPGDLNWSRLVPGTIRRLHQGERPLVRRPPQGDFKRDFIHVDDVVGAYMSLLKGLTNPQNHGQAFNFGMGGSWTVLDVVRRIQQRLGREEIEPAFESMKHGEIRQQQLAIDKARRVLDWAPRYSLEDGLDATIPWYQRLLAGDARASSSPA